MVIYWELPEHQRGKEDDYWEQALWYLYYNIGHVGDIEYAKKTWPWANMETNETTWSDKYLEK